MNAATFVRKCAYTFSGSLFLSDYARNFAYTWAWSHVRGLPKSSAVLDVGCRDSLFPAFLAWRGYRVTAIEKDTRFARVKTRISRCWNVDYEMEIVDFIHTGISAQFNAILSIFGLQHAGDDDIPAYKKAVKLLTPGGLFLSVCEFDWKATRWQTGRDDGALRIYGPGDIVQRIEKPLSEGGVEIVEKKFARKASNSKLIWESAAEQAEFCFVYGKMAKYA